MEVFTIKGENVILMYHAADEAAEVGQQFAILERPSLREGLVVQVISNDSLEYPGLQQEIIQKILEERAATTNVILDREQGMGQIRNIKLALAKIRKKIHNGHWQRWDGWIPTRSVDISPIGPDTLIQNIIPTPTVPLNSFCGFKGHKVQFNGPNLNMVNVITGVKGSGKSHIAKHLLLALASANVPCIVFDINGEYINLPNVQALRWGENFSPNLAEVGYEMLVSVIEAIYPLTTETAKSVFDIRLPQAFTQRRDFCQKRGQTFTIDIPWLRQQYDWGGGSYVDDAIKRRLQMVEEMGLFLETTSPPQSQEEQEEGGEEVVSDLTTAYERAIQGRPIIFNMKGMETKLQTALVKAVNQLIEKICEREERNKAGRFPFMFYEEAHFYISEHTILNIITRGRHIGMASVFITNSPQKLPDTVFRQLDNLFLLNLTHKDDIRNVSKNSFTDEDTIDSFATRLPERHALIIGNLTDRYPLIVEILDLPPGVPPTGRTRSTWDRFTRTSTAMKEEDLQAINGGEEVPF